MRSSLRAAKLIRADKAAKGVADAAKATKKAAQAAARETAKRAKEAAQAAKLAANLSKDIAKNVAGSAAKQFSNALKGIGSAVGGLFKKKKKSAPPRPPNPNDCSSSQFWNHVTKQCHARGYKMYVDTRKGSSKPQCIEIIGAVIHNGQHARIWPCNGGWWQQWRHMPNGEIRTPNGRCLDGKKLKVGEHVHTWTCHGGRNQKWTVDHIGRIKTRNGLCAVPVPASSYGNRLELKNCSSVASNKRPWTAVTLFEDYHRKYGFSKEYLLPIHMYGEWACHAENHVYACNAAPAF